LREKEPAPTNLSTYTNITGRAKCTIQCQNPKLLNNYNGVFIEKYESILKNIKEAIYMIKSKSQELSHSINMFGDSIDDLSDLFSDAGFDNNIALYNDIRCITTAYEESVRQQADVILDKLKLDINFHLLSANSFKEFDKHKENVYWEFYKVGKDLQSKKDKFWEDREKKETHSRWMLNTDDAKIIDKLMQNEFEAKAKMLPKETQYAWDKNNEFKHLQRRSIEEIDRCNEVLGGKIRKKFVDIAHEQLNIINR
jgi:hypothetical protein